MEPWKPLPLFLPMGNISIRQVFACMVRPGRPEFGIGFLGWIQKVWGNFEWDIVQIEDPERW